MNKTYIPKKTKQDKEIWYLVDAKNKNLGRLSAKIASILQGKNNIKYTPYINLKQYIIIINAKHITVTGQKRQQKVYKRHSGRPGGLKIITFEELHKKFPSKIIEKSIKGMLPKTVLGKKLFGQLKIYSESHHPHIAQKPEAITLN